MKRSGLRLDDPLFLVTGFLFLLIFTARAPYSWGEASRLATVEALVDRGTPILDGGSYPGQADRLITANGMASHKPPGMQFALVPPYFLLSRLGLKLESKPVAVYIALTLVCCGAAWLFGGFVLHRRHRALGISRWRSAFLVAAVLFGSLMLPYGLALNAHLPAGVMIMIGLLLLGGQNGRADRFLAGLLFGLAFSFDHAAMFPVAAAVILRWLKQREGSLTIVAGLLPGIVLSLVWYRYLGGSWLPLVFEQERFNYAYSPWILMSLTGSWFFEGFPSYLFQLTFGESGLFSNHPVLLFPLAALFVQWRRDRDWTAGAALLGFLITLLYYALRSRNMGGDCFGIRWLAIVVPPLCLGLTTVGEWLRHRGIAVLFGLALIPSLAFAAVGAAQPWMKFHLSNPDPLREDRPLSEHLQDEFERRSAPPPSFDMPELIRFYRENLRRLRRVTQQEAEAGAGPNAYRRALETTSKMLERTTEDWLLWQVHSEMLKGAGRLTEADEARTRSLELRAAERAGPER